MRDAVVAYHIGMALEKLHHEFDLSQTVSVADMATCQPWEDDLPVHVDKL